MGLGSPSLLGQSHSQIMVLVMIAQRRAFTKSHCTLKMFRMGKLCCANFTSKTDTDSPWVQDSWLGLGGPPTLLPPQEWLAVPCVHPCPRAFAQAAHHLFFVSAEFPLPTCPQ